MAQPRRIAVQQLNLDVIQEALAAAGIYPGLKTKNIEVVSTQAVRFRVAGGAFLIGPDDRQSAGDLQIVTTYDGNTVGEFTITIPKAGKKKFLVQVYGRSSFEVKREIETCLQMIMGDNWTVDFTP